MKKILKTKYFIPVACILFGVFFTIYCYMQYELWDSIKGPMPGFLPFVIGILLFLTGAAALPQAIKDEEPVYQKDNGILILCVLAVCAGNYVIGLLPSIFIFLFGWLRFKGKCSWKTTIITMIVMMVLILGIFLFWLEIPFAKGILFEQLLG